MNFYWIWILDFGFWGREECRKLDELDERIQGVRYDEIYIIMNRSRRFWVSRSRFLIFNRFLEMNIYL